jgi:BCD family chlorophyll transporter-like MFS transporter
MNFSDTPTPTTTVNNTTLSTVKILTILRLGLFNLGLGLMSVLTLAVLNRISIGELSIPATIVAGTIAMSQFIAPARVWFGQLSDNKPLFGLHRSSYVRIGTVIFSIAIFCAVQIIWQLGIAVNNNGSWAWNVQTMGLTALLSLIFAVYGLAVSSSSTPFTALLVDISDEKERSKLVAIVWSMLMVGIVIGGISGKIILRKIEQTGTILGVNIGANLLTGEQSLKTSIEALQNTINPIFAVVPFIIIGLAFLATWGVEKKYSRFADRSNFKDREDSITLKDSLKILTSSRQTGIFFSFLIVFTISLFMQEAVLEPYGGEVFGMSIADTTFLNSFWGIGILLGYGTTGFFVIPRLGKTATARVGCFLTAICFLLIILAGVTQQPLILRITMILFGIAAGIATIGGISLMLDLTAAATAGTFIGAWGLAQAMSRALATVAGGVVLDVGRSIFQSPLLAYSSVFAIQAVGMLSAIVLLNRVNVTEFKSNTEAAIATVMEGDLD